ncbi:LacI family DNA-binding transcriptional regulator [Pseudonocardia sp. GCM10023141]|uniref:LacI family DNA-binding transcriptional regulator n=1 Tax=Pseudonocardia sp. GCM10023141 TaxID=3252653 RepID=UPI0036103891
MVDEASPRAARRSGHPSIVDVAEVAGVSAATVSRSLRGHHNVTAATRSRVLEAARKLGYTVSPHASGLASGRTSTVGIVVPFVNRWFFANVVAAAYAVLREASYDVLLYHLRSAADRERFFEQMPLARRVDAVLTLAMPLGENHMLALRALDIPLVVLGDRVGGASSVRIDDVDVARAAVHHLLHQGHERIMLVTSPHNDHDLGSVSSRNRIDGYRQAMSAAGFTRNEQVVAALGPGIEGGASTMAAVLAEPTLPTAIIAEYDELAIGAIRTLRRSSVAVPARMSMIGVDDHEMASVVDLTTIAQPVQAQGRTAAQLLLDTIGGRLPAPVDVVLETQLVVRGSTGPPHAPTPRPRESGRTAPRVGTD